ncbi:MAG: hypothetical protein EBU26_11285 [Verrucomicrobia bacterium]|nr:hypothetical protein [Verrucomicrobiota bacterium]
MVIQVRIPANKQHGQNQGFMKEDSLEGGKMQAWFLVAPMKSPVTQTLFRVMTGSTFWNRKQKADFQRLLR